MLYINVNGTWSRNILYSCWTYMQRPDLKSVIMWSRYRLSCISLAEMPFSGDEPLTSCCTWQWKLQISAVIDLTMNFASYQRAKLESLVELQLDLITRISLSTWANPPVNCSKRRNIDMNPTEMLLKRLFSLWCRCVYYLSSGFDSSWLHCVIQRIYLFYALQQVYFPPACLV